MTTEAGFGGPQFAQITNSLQNLAFQFGAASLAAQELGAIIQTFRLLERELTLANAVAGGTVKTFREMEAAARSFARASRFSVSEVANSFYFLAAAGFSAKEAMAAASGVLILSQATLTELNRTADLVASSISAFGLTAQDSLRIANLFVAAANNSLATLEKLEFAFRQVAPVADSANLSIEETVAALNQLFNVGLRGEQAGTAFRNIIVRLINPVGDAEKILQELGIRTVELDGQLRNVFDILSDIGDANLSQGTLAKIFGTEAVAGATALINSIQGGKFQENLEVISGTQDAVSLALKQLQTLDGVISQAGNSLTELRLSLGETFADTLKDILLGFIEFVDMLKSLDPAILSAIGNTLAWAAAFGVLAKALLFLGPIMAGWVTGMLNMFRNSVAFFALFRSVNSFGSFITLLRMAPGPMIAFGAALAAVTYLVHEFFSTLDEERGEGRLDVLAGEAVDFTRSIQQTTRALSLMFREIEGSADGAVGRFNAMKGAIDAARDAIGTTEDQLAKLRAEQQNVATIRTAGQQSSVQVGGGGLFDPVSLTGFEALFDPGAIVDNLSDADQSRFAGLFTTAGPESLVSLFEQLAKTQGTDSANEAFSRIKTLLEENAGLRNAIVDRIATEVERLSKEGAAFTYDTLAALFSDEALGVDTGLIAGRIAQGGAALEEANRTIEQAIATQNEAAQNIVREMAASFSASSNEVNQLLGQELKAAIDSGKQERLDALLALGQTGEGEDRQFDIDAFKAGLIDQILGSPREFSEEFRRALEDEREVAGRRIIDTSAYIRETRIETMRMLNENLALEAKLARDALGEFFATQEKINQDLAVENRAKAEAFIESVKNDLVGIGQIFASDKDLFQSLQEGTLTFKESLYGGIRTVTTTLDLASLSQEELRDALIRYFAAQRGGAALTLQEQANLDTVIERLVVFFEQYNARNARANLELRRQAELFKEDMKEALETIRGLTSDLDGDLRVLDVEIAAALDPENPLKALDAALARADETFRRAKEDIESSSNRDRLRELFAATIEGASKDDPRVLEAADAHIREQIDLIEKRRQLDEIRAREAANRGAKGLSDTIRGISEQSRELGRELGEALTLKIDEARLAVDPNDVALRLDVAIRSIEAEFIDRVEGFRQKLESATGVGGYALYSPEQIQEFVASFSEGERIRTDLLIQAAKEESERFAREYEASLAQSRADISRLLADAQNEMFQSLVGAGNSFADANGQTIELAIKFRIQAQRDEAQSEFIDQRNAITEAYELELEAATRAGESTTELTAAYAEQLGYLDALLAARLQSVESMENEAKVARETAIERVNGFIEQNKYSSDFFEGVRLGFERMALEAPSAFDVGVQSLEMGINGLADTFTNMFFETEQSWDEMLANMLKQLAQFVIRAAIMQLALQAIGGFSGGGVQPASGTGFVKPTFGSALGNAFGVGANLFRNIPRAAGGRTIFKHPTIFNQYGEPVSTISEEQDEVIFPLSRDSQGRMGIHAQLTMSGAQGAGEPKVRQSGAGGVVVNYSPNWNLNVNEFAEGGGGGGKDQAEGLTNMMKNIDNSVRALVATEVQKHTRPGGIIEQQFEKRSR